MRNKKPTTDFARTIFSKKMIFFLLSFALNAFEMFRNDSNFDIWSVTTNLTGIVIFLFVLTQINVKKLFSVSSLVITIFSVIACAFASTIKDRWFPTSITWQVVTAIANVWWIAIIWAYRIKEIACEYKKSKTIRKPSIISLVWVASGIWVIISKSEMIWPVWFVGMFSAFYCTEYNEKDWYNMWNGIISGTIWSYVIFEVVHMPFRPYDIEPRYSGFMINSNNFACYTAIVLLMVLVKINMLFVQKKTKWLIALYSLLAMILLDISFMTGCRTVWLLEAVLLCIWIVLVVRKKWKTSILKVLIGTITALIVTVILLYPTYLAIRYVPTIHPHPIWFSTEYAEYKVHSWDPADSDKYVSWEEMLDTNAGRLRETFEGLLSKSPFVMKAKAKEIDTILVPNEHYDGIPESINIRLNYYKAYISEFNLMGNNTQEKQFYTESGSFIWHAQNYWIQVIYMFGIPYGILMLVILFGLARNSIIAFKSEDDYGINILPFLFLILYVIYGIFEVTWLPGYIILTMMYLVQHPQFIKKKQY